MAIILPKREQGITKTTSNDPTGQQITYGGAWMNYSEYEKTLHELDRFQDTDNTPQFGERIAKGKIGESVYLAYRGNKPTQDVREDEQYQAQDIDFIESETGRTVEVKTDLECWRKGTIFLPTEEANTGGTMESGWLFTSKANDFVFVLPNPEAYRNADTEGGNCIGMICMIRVHADALRKDVAEGLNAGQYKREKSRETHGRYILYPVTDLFRLEGTTVLMEPLLLDDGQLLLCPSVDIYGKLLASYELWRIPEIRKAACSAAGLSEGFFMQEIEESKTEFLHIQNIWINYIKVTHPNTHRALSAEHRIALQRTLSASRQYGIDNILPTAILPRYHTLIEICMEYASAANLPVNDTGNGKFFVCCPTTRLSQQYGGGQATWCKHLALLETWGLIERIHDHWNNPHKAIRTEAGRSWAQGYAHPSTWIYIPPLTRYLAEKAKPMIAKWKTAKASGHFGKGTIIALYGEETANRVYGDDRKETSEQIALQADLQALLLHSIQKKGYATKDEFPSAPEQEKAFRRILASGAYTYQPPTKEMAERYNLTERKWIITQAPIQP